LNRILVDSTSTASTNFPCTPSSTQCLWKETFGGWGLGFAGFMRVVNTTTGDACVDTGVEATSSLLDGPVVFHEITGAAE